MTCAATHAARVTHHHRREQSMRDQDFKCVDCGKLSPPTDEGETITKQHGWRVTRNMVGGIVIIEPRCPECYARAKSSLPPTARRSRKPGG